MDIWLAIILGLVQGFVEFLPISSSGHLVIAEHLFSVNFNFVMLNVVLHLATLIAVIIFYRKKVWYMITHPFCSLNKKLLIATIPAIVAVLLFKSFVEAANHSILFVGIGFLITAVLIGAAGFLAKRTIKPNPVGYRTSVFMGLAQAIAVLPGISRSGATLAIGLLDGAERKQTLEFSFLMSIPIIIASAVYELVFKNPFAGLVTGDILSLLLASCVAFAAAVFGIKLMQRLVEKVKFGWFVLYLVLAGAATLVLALI
ncbi:MAG: undecaprenyl-diphosphate phosphatase [Firmicutes bacterium]|nr:undecaprenyl-diphosphate phosphatase [Bacillota bacterium]